MTGNAKARPITIDLNQFKLHIALKNRIELTLHFNSPSRRFYLSVIALVVNEMKRQGKIISIPLEGHHGLLALLNETIGCSAGSSEEENLLSRIYKKWQYALPNLEEAPLFMVLGRKKGYEEGIGKTYPFTEAAKDSWANLFEYKGSHENVRLKFAIDKIGASLNDIVILYEDFLNGEAWEKFISSLKEKGVEKQEAEPDKRVSEEAEVVASTEKMAFPLPDVPSIAVLPFVNMSEDPKQEFLCDGITENIITALSKVPRLFVISRQSTFFYKGKPVKVKQVSEELGVQYVLEGSFQRSGDRVRVTVQLIDALTGHHLWAERYDRDLKDIFALQDEITIKILTGVQVKLEGGDVSGAEKYAEKYYRGKQGLDCYLKLMQGMGYWARLNIEDNNRARRMVEEAIAMCPENPWGYIDLGWICYFDYVLGNTKSPRETIEKGIELAQKAFAMDGSIAPFGHGLLSRLYGSKGEHDKAIAEGERAVALYPSGWGVLCNYGQSLTWAGRPDEAIPLFQKAIRLNPFGPVFLYANLARALGLAGRFEESVSVSKKAIQLAPDDIGAHLDLVATYSAMGREKEARAEAAEVLRINPKFSVDSWAKNSPFKDQSFTDNAVNLWRKAGLK